MYMAGGPVNASNGLGLIVMGIMMIFGGVMFNVLGSIADSSDPFQEDSGFQDFACIAGGGSIIVGIILLVLGYHVWSKEDLSSDVEEDIPDEPEREVVKTYEVIKVRCRYCGTLNDVNAPTCVSCGARL